MIQFYMATWLMFLRISRHKVSARGLEVAWRPTLGEGIVAPDSSLLISRSLQSLSEDELTLLKQCYDRASLTESDSLFQTSSDAVTIELEFSSFVGGSELIDCTAGLFNATINGDPELTCSCDYKSYQNGDAFSRYASACSQAGGDLLLANVSRACDREGTAFIENFSNLPDCVNRTSSLTCDLSLYERWLEGEYLSGTESCNATVAADFDAGNVSDDVEPAVPPADSPVSSDQKTTAPTSASNMDGESNAPAATPTTDRDPDPTNGAGPSSTSEAPITATRTFVSCWYTAEALLCRVFIAHLISIVVHAGLF
jgi:hypothetical protein